MGIYRAKSYPEQYIGYICKQNFNHVELNKKMVNGLEADIVIYDLNTIIEYSGVFWHADAERDRRKRKFIEQHGIRLITIYEYRVSRLSEEKIAKVDKDTLHFYKASNKSSSLNKVVDELSKMLNVQLKVEPNIENKVHEMVDADYHDQCLAVQYPDIAAELLDYDPYKVTISDTTRKFNWKCSTCGNIFSTAVAHRVYRKTQCPYCCGNKAIPGKTDIVTVLPGFAKEIISLTEDELRNTLPYSTKQVTWKCSQCSHEWDTTIITRTKYNSGCPVCGYVPKEYDSEWHNLEELINDTKHIAEVIMFNKHIKHCKYIELFNEALAELDNRHPNDISNTVDNEKFAVIRSKRPFLSLHKDLYKIPKSIKLSGLIVYYESHCGAGLYLKILAALLEYLGESKDSIKIKLDTDDINTKKVRYVHKPKNKNMWNVMYRLRIHEDDEETQMVFIGSRPTFNEAVLLKLSSEIYYFGKIRDNTDTYFGDIPVFENTPEFEKLKQAGRIRKQY